MPGTATQPNNTARDAIAELTEILRQWEDEHNVAGNDPTPHLIKLCELFELHHNNYLRKDPDPFDDRHPVTSDPDGALGQLLRALFKRDTFVNKLVNHYMRDNFSSHGPARDSTPINTAACRLMLDLLQGLDVPQVFRDSESTVSKLFTWAEKAPEPLRTYATGLLSAAVDIPDIATNFRDSNAHLLPIMLNRLWDLKDEGGGDDSSDTVPARPFAHLNNESDGACSAPPASYSAPSGGGLTTPTKKASDTGAGSGPISENSNSATVKGTLNRTPLKSLTDLTASFSGYTNNATNCLNSSMINSDCSNSSWAEMSSYIVGSYQMYPMARDTKVLFILKYLRPVGEYQESLGHVFEYRAMDLIFHYINVRKTCHARLSFEALRFLGSLLFHKKFCLEFVNRGGVQILLQIPRPSLPADGVALCLWYLGYCEEAIERICLLPDLVLEQLIRYSLWLIESGHPSARTHSIMFFCLVFRFQAILDRFDRQDGLRKLINVLSTMSILQDGVDEDVPEEAHLLNEAMVWHTVKHVCLTVKSYFDAHLAIRANNFHRCSNNAATPCYKPLNVSWESVNRNAEILLESLPLKARWEPVENFLKLKGVAFFVKILAVVLNDSYSTHQSETAVSALDALYICSVMPQVQMSLCDKITIPAGEDLFRNVNPMEATGFAVLVACIPDNQQPINGTPEVQRAALNVLVNCLCAPLQRSCAANSSVPRPTRSKVAAATGEEVVRKSWDCVRTSNGIMYLLALLHKKLPITDADATRALACRALVGLSRSDATRQIMSKLPVFTQGQLQLLMREPIIQEKRADHVKFQRYALELINAVSGKSNSTNASSDISLVSIHKADVVAQTRIGYNKKQLLQLMQMHLLREGLYSAATALQVEANLPVLQQPSAMPPPRALTGSPATRIRLHPVGTPRNIFSHSPLTRTPLHTPSSAPSPPPFPASPITTPSVRSNASIGCGLPTTAVGPTPLPIRLGRGLKRSVDGKVLTPITPTSHSNFSKSENLTPSTLEGTSSPGVVATVLSSSALCGNGFSVPGAASSIGSTAGGVSLDGIVREYLTNQHALCPNPVVTCPTFDLFHPHRCPEPRANRISGSYNNITHRLTHRAYISPRVLRGISSNNNMRGIHHGCTLPSLSRRFAYSKYRASDVIRPSADGGAFVTACFANDDKSLFVGTMRGVIAMFNLSNPVEESAFNAHQGHVTQLSVHKSGTTLLSSCSSVTESMLWSLEEVYASSEPKFHMTNCHHAIFTNAYDKILGTNDAKAVLYDITTQTAIHDYRPTLSNQYHSNRADIHPQDDLILTDGVLFDVRSGKEIHKFDKINPVVNGSFHHNGLEVISSSDVWDLRSYHLLRTVPALNKCNVIFNSTNDVIFGVTDLYVVDEENFDTSFKVIDAVNFSSIATVDTRRVVSSLAINHTDAQLAVVETAGCQEEVNDVTVVRLYDVAMTRQEEDEDPMSDEEDLNSEDDSDTDDDDPQHDDGGNDDDDDDNDDDIQSEGGTSESGQDVSLGEVEDDEDLEYDVSVSIGSDDDQSDSESVLFELSTDNPPEAETGGSVTWLRSQLVEAMRGTEQRFATDSAGTSSRPRPAADSAGTSSRPRPAADSAGTSSRPKRRGGSGARSNVNLEPMDEDEDQWEDIGEDEDEEEEL